MNELIEIIPDNEYPFLEERNEVQVFRIEPSGKPTLLYNGKMNESIERRCEKHANASGCSVMLELQNGLEARFFSPISPKDIISENHEEYKTDLFSDIISIISNEFAGYKMQINKRMFDARHALVTSPPHRHTAGKIEWFSISVLMSGKSKHMYINGNFDTYEEANDVYKEVCLMASSKDGWIEKDLTNKFKSNSSSIDELDKLCSEYIRDHESSTITVKFSDGTEKLYVS